MSGAYCPKCPCDSCEQVRAFLKPRDDRFTDYGTLGPQVVKVGVTEPECAFERIAREYRERGEPMPTGWLLYCGCRRCSPTC